MPYRERGKNMDASVIPSLQQIERLRRPLFKIFLFKLEGMLGQLLYRKSPPKEFKGMKYLNLGCGDHHFEGWVNADFYRFSDLIRKKRGLPNWMLDAGKSWKCPSHYWDGIYTEHTIEHLDYNGACIALAECYRTMKPGASLRVIVPGIEKTMDNTVNDNALAVAHLTQTHGHVSVWSEGLLKNLLQEIGFNNVKVVKFQEGTNKDLIKDLEERKSESIYVEAIK